MSSILIVLGALSLLNARPPAQPATTRRELLGRAVALGGLAPAARLSALLPAAAALGGQPTCALAAESSAPPQPLDKVVVLGGSGFVGMRICERLVALGVPTVVSVSRGGRPASAVGGWAEKVQWVAADVGTDADALGAQLKGAQAAISAVGVIFGGGAEADRASNAGPNVAAARAAAAAGVGRFVYVSVSDSVGPVASPLVGGGYFAGKAEAEAAILAAFSPERSLLIKPTFIYGGAAFSLSPPRVAGAYGAIVDGLLSSGPLRALAAVAPGPVALALAPPISVDAVAAAAVAGALGTASGSADGHDAIVKAAASAPAAVVAP